MNCENNSSRCTEIEVEEVTALATPQLPALRLRLCHYHASAWACVLEKRDREFNRTSLVTGESMKFRPEHFVRTARVGRGVAHK